MRILSNLFFLLLVIGCSSADSNLLKNDETIASVFSESEISELQKILDFFTEKICESEGVSSTAPSDCFESYLLSQHKSAPSSGVYTIPISFQDQEDLFSIISDETFDQIWIRTTSSDGTFLDINVRGKYLQFLDLLSKDETNISEYTEQILFAGTIGVAAQSNILYFPEKFNTADIRIRFLIAVHFLTINGTNWE